MSAGKTCLYVSALLAAPTCLCALFYRLIGVQAAPEIGLLHLEGKDGRIDKAIIS